MGSKTIRQCNVCNMACDGAVSEFCSETCRMSAMAADSFGDAIKKQKPTSDNRIYFYDFAFGDLCDLFSTYLIRRIRTKDIVKQRIVDRALEKLERAVLTKLNRYSPIPPIRVNISNSLKRLVSLNTRIWLWRDEFYSAESVPAEAWKSYKALYRARDAARQELDMLVEGHTMTEKGYDK